MIVPQFCKVKVKYFASEASGQDTLHVIYIFLPCWNKYCTDNKAIHSVTKVHSVLFHFLHRCNSKLPWCGIYGRRSNRKDWNILCIQEKSQFPCLAYAQMSITCKIRNIKEKYWHAHLCTELWRTHTSHCEVNLSSAPSLFYPTVPLSSVREKHTFFSSSSAIFKTV